MAEAEIPRICECGHGVDCHLAGIGCTGIIGWEDVAPSGIEAVVASGALPEVEAQLGLIFGKPAEAPILCGCLEGITGEPHEKAEKKEDVQT